MKRRYFLMIMLLLSGSFSLSAQNFRPGKIKVACVGNSITYGYGIKHRDSLSYPAQLQRMMGDKFNVRNFGVSGRTLLKKGDYPYWKEKVHIMNLYKALKPYGRDFFDGVHPDKTGAHYLAKAVWRYIRHYKK